MRRTASTTTCSTPAPTGRTRFEEYWRLVDDVTLWDLGVERIVEGGGEDAFADTLTSQDLTASSVGQGQYAPLTAADGVWMRWPAPELPLAVEISEPDAHPVPLQSSKSRPLVDDLFGPAISDLDYYHCAEADLDNIPVPVSRTGWFSEVGYVVFLLDSRHGEELWEQIVDAGEPYVSSRRPPLELRRIEAGIFNYGSDMTLANNPF